MKTAARFVTFSALLALVSAPAIARDWDYVTTRKDGLSIAVAANTITRRGGYASALFRFRNTTQVWQTFVSIDCTAVTAAAARLPGSGEAPVTALPPLAPPGPLYRPVKPETIAADMYVRLCPDAVNTPIYVGPASGASLPPSPGPQTN